MVMRVGEVEYMAKLMRIAHTRMHTGTTPMRMHTGTKHTRMHMGTKHTRIHTGSKHIRMHAHMATTLTCKYTTATKRYPTHHIALPHSPHSAAPLTSLVLPPSR